MSYNIIPKNIIKKTSHESTKMETISTENDIYINATVMVFLH